MDSIFRNTFFSLIARGIDVVVTFALAVILARYLGAEGMGQYTYAIAFVAIFVPLVDLGLDHILIREISRRTESPAGVLGRPSPNSEVRSARDTSEHLVGAALLLKIWIALLAMPLGMAVAFLIGHRGIDLWVILLCFLGTLLFREVPTVVGYAVFLDYERMEFRVLATLFFQILKFVCTLPVVILGWGCDAASAPRSSSP